MKKTSKKIVGGIMVVSLLASIGTIFATAQDDGTTEDFAPNDNFLGGTHMNRPDLFNKNMTENGFFYFDLTEDQQDEINELRISLQDQGVNSSEIREAINEKLDEFGVFDQRLENEIEKTEERLQILNREKELRDQGYGWDEIKTILQDEFGIDILFGDCNHDMMGRHAFGKGFFRGPDDLISGEKSDQ